MVGVSEKSNKSSTVSAGKSIVCLFNNGRETNLLSNRDYANEVADLFEIFFKQIDINLELVVDASVGKLGSYCCDKIVFELAKCNATKADNLTAELYRLSFVIPKLNLLFTHIASVKSIMFWSALMARRVEICAPILCPKKEFLDFCLNLLDSDRNFQQHGPFIETILCCVCIVLKSTTDCCVKMCDSHPIVSKLESKMCLGDFAFYGTYLSLKKDESSSLEKMLKLEHQWANKSVADLELFTFMSHFKNYIKNRLMQRRTDLSKGDFENIVDFVSVFCNLLSNKTSKSEELNRVCRNFAIDCYNNTITFLQNDFNFLLQITNSEDEKFLDGKIERMKRALIRTNSDDEDLGSKLTANLARFAISQLKFLSSANLEKKGFDIIKLKAIFCQLSRLVFANDEDSKRAGIDTDKCLNQVRTISSIAYWASKCGLISCSEDCQFYKSQFMNLLTRRTPIELLMNNDEVMKDYMKCWQALQRYTDYKLSLINDLDDSWTDFMTESSTNEDLTRCKALKSFFLNSIGNSIDLIVVSRNLQFLLESQPVKDIHAFVKIDIFTPCDETQLLTRILNAHLGSIGNGDDVKQIQIVCNMASVSSSCKVETCNCAFRVTGMRIITDFLIDNWDRQDWKQESLKCPFADHLEQIISMLTNSLQRKKSRETFDVELGIMMMHVASVLEFYGLKMQALYVWTFVSSQSYSALKRVIVSSSSSLPSDAEKWSVVCSISVFYGFNTAFSCGSLSICMKLEQLLLKTISLLPENEQHLLKSFFGKEFLRLKLDACMKRRELAAIIKDTLSLIDTDSLKPWSVFSSALAIDFLVDLLSESELSSTDLSNISESLSVDAFRTRKPFYAFFAKWKVEVFRYWKSLCRKSINFCPEVENYKPILPLFLNVQLKQPLCGLLVAPFSYQNYTQLSHMVKAIGLVDVSKSYDSFISEGNYIGQSHSRILKQIFEAKSFIESAYSYAYVHLFDRCYESLVKCANVYLEPEARVLFEARDRIDSSTEVSDSKKIQAQQGLSDNIPQIPLSKLVAQFRAHSIECLCADNCGDIAKFDNIALLVSMINTLPGSYCGKKETEIAAINQGKLLDILNSKLKRHCKQIEDLMSEYDDISDRASEGSKDVAKSTAKSGAKNRTRCISTGNENQKSDCHTLSLHMSFVSRYHFNGTIPSIQKFTRISFASTSLAAQATLEGLLQQQTKDNSNVRLKTKESSTCSEVPRYGEIQFYDVLFELVA